MRTLTLGFIACTLLNSSCAEPRLNQNAVAKSQEQVVEHRFTEPVSESLDSTAIALQIFGLHKSLIEADTGGIIAFLDTTYVVEQLGGVLGGDTAQFLNELLCGNSNIGFRCARLSELKQLAIVKIQADGQVGKYAFKVKTTADIFIIGELYYKVIRQNDELVLRFRGGVG